MSTVATPTFQAVPVAAIRPSKFNPRRRFDEAKLKELAQSIARDGVLEPILLRPVPPAKDGTRFAIVAGERRWRAASQAKLAEIPAIIRELSDAQALEIAVVENLQREGLNPIEEAEGFERLVKEHHYTVEDLAAKVGKSRTYVYTRLKLTSLPENAKAALWEDRLAVNVALLIARIPDPKLQAEAAETIVSGEGGDPFGFRSAARYIQERFMLALARAPFPTGDAALLPEAGACTTCPKRTANDRDLFGEVGKADLCTDVTCFQAKKEAAWVRVQRQAGEGGPPTLDDQRSKGLFHYGQLRHGSPYVDHAAVCEDDSQRRTWQKLLGKHAPKGALARDDEGRIHRLIDRTEARGALRKAGFRFAVEVPSARNAPPRAGLQRQEQARRRRLEVLRRTAEQALAGLVDRIEAKEPDLRIWRAMLDGLAATAWHEALDTVAKRRGWLGKKVRPEDAVRAHAEKLPVPQLRGLLAEIVLTRGAYTPYGTPAFSKPLTQACQAAGIELRKLEHQVKHRVGQKGGKTKGQKTK